MDPPRVPESVTSDYGSGQNIVETAAGRLPTESYIDTEWYNGGYALSRNSSLRMAKSRKYNLQIPFCCTSTFYRITTKAHFGNLFRCCFYFVILGRDNSAYLLIYKLLCGKHNLRMAVRESYYYSVVFVSLRT